MQGSQTEERAYVGNQATYLKGVFARHGLPEVVRSDSGPQYSLHDFAGFAESYDFRHVTSTPLNPQSNGQAERAVQTVKTY